METRVVGVYVHGPRSTRPDDAEPTPMVEIESVEAVEVMGLREDARYFRQVHENRQRKRQVSLIDEGTVRRLEKSFGTIPQEFVKSQIVLAGDVHLPSLIGSTLRFSGGAELKVALERKPCYAMDLIASGLREAMEEGQQGALAMVTAGGRISRGDAVTVLTPALADAAV